MAESNPLRFLRRGPGDMSPRGEKRKNQIVLDSDEEGASRPTSAVASGGGSAGEAAEFQEVPPSGGETFWDHEEHELERAAMAFLRNRGYSIKDAGSNVALQVQHRCKAFQKLALWATSTVPPILDELMSALGPLAGYVSDELTKMEGEGSASKRFKAKYQDLLRRDARRAKSDASEGRGLVDGKRQVVMSELSHQLLLTYLGRPEMSSLLDVFFDTMVVKRRTQPPSSSAIFCETANVVAGDDKSKRRKGTSSKILPLPSEHALQAGKDLLKRPASIVSLVVDAPHNVPVQAGSISDDLRFCAASCDRDVRIFRADETRFASLSPTTRLEGQRLGCHGGRVLSTAFSPKSDLLLSGGLDGCIQLWSTSTNALTSTYRQLDPVWCLDWTPLGHYFVSSGKDGEALLWNAARGSSKPLRVYGAAGPEVQALRVQPDGRRVVVAHCDSFVFWDLNTALPTRILRASPGAGTAAVTTMAFSASGDVLAAGLVDGGITLLDLRALRTPQALQSRPLHSGVVSSVCWSRVSTAENLDVLFSTSGSNMLMRELSAFEEIDQVDIKLGMDHVLCSRSSVGHTVVLGTTLT